MKKILSIMMLCIFAISSYAQKDVTEFLGIPVDGSKSEMIRKLKAKGFTSNRYNADILEGEFNGTDVNIHIHTNNNKVWRIAVADASGTNEGNIKTRFNNLCRQFENNNKYISFEKDSFMSILSNHTLSDDEDISYEISVNNKRYEATYYQRSIDEDSDNFFNKTVWFTIMKISGKYHIVIFYENKYNQASGEDL